MPEELSVINPFNNAPVLFYETVASTMDTAFYLHSQGYPSGTVVITQNQTAGRGRAKRCWFSNEQSLIFSLLLSKVFPALENSGILPLLAALAWADALSPIVSIEIKWPNDLMLHEKKIGGILCEVKGDTVVLGCGINCMQTCFPEALNEKAGSLFLLTGKNIQHFALLEKFLSCFQFVLSDAQWKEKIEKRLFCRNKTVYYRIGTSDSNQVVQGRLIGIDGSGALLMEQQNRRRSIISGEWMGFAE
jgi:BirA family biotin operon repressor/biotin-[acetyl-CoA-carboxylase] ligase